MKALRDYRDEILREIDGHWEVPFRQFVDDFRREHDMSAIAAPTPGGNPEVDALRASTIEFICHEQGLENPAWTWDVPALAQPWFVSGFENLKAICIVESPVQFRRRLIFTLKNVLERV
ncbi:MAG: hypothetical protein HZA20_12285 [Nitrospirae bacterium]|nr:hypothetical protein [Nitrospirota bacterium]